MFRSAAGPLKKTPGRASSTPCPVALFVEREPSLVGPRLASNALGMLAEAFRAVSKERLTLDLLCSHPRVLHLSLAICEYLTHHVPAGPVDHCTSPKRVSTPDPRSSLLTACLGDGLSSWESGRNGIQSFAKGLLERVPHAAKWHAFCRRGRESETWDVTKGSLSAWMRVNGATPFIAPRPPFVEPVVPASLVRGVVVARAFEQEDFLAFDYDVDFLVWPKGAA